MKRIDRSKKKGGVSTRPSSKLSQQIPLHESEFFKNSSLNQKIYLIVLKWRSAHRKFKWGYERLSSLWKVNQGIRDLKKVNMLLKDIAPWLRGHPTTFTIEVKSLKSGARREIKLIDLLVNTGFLKMVAHWLSKTDLKRGGRPPKEMIANCAEELADLFKKETGQLQWPRVGDIVADAFLEKRPAKNLGPWIYTLVKRNRRRKGKI